MNPQCKIEVIDKDGWRKTYPLQKNIIYIGSHVRSDIVLEGEHGGGVAPLHAQLIASNNNTTGYQLVNLANMDIRLGAAGDQTLPPRAVIDIADGETFILGEFTLVFHSEGEIYGGTVSGGSRYIGLSLAMPQTRLAPNQSLDGIVTVRNLGDRTGVQMELTLEGLDPDCYDLEPGPLLSSGAEKEVFFRLYQRGMKPLAGDWQITIRATAPRAYPAEQATISQVIQVLPYYHHRLKLLAPGERDTAPLAEEDLLTPIAKAGPPPPVKERPASPAQAGPPPQPEAQPAAKLQASAPSAEDWWTAPADVSPQPPQAAPTPPQAKPAAQAEAGPPPQAVAQQPPKAEPGPGEAEPSPPVEAAPPPPIEAEAAPETEAEILSETIAPQEPQEVELPPPSAAVEVGPPPPVEREEASAAEIGRQPPRKKWWAGLVGLIPFYRRKAHAPPTASTEAGKQLWVEAEPAVKAEASPPPPVEEKQIPEPPAGMPAPGEAEQVPPTEAKIPLPVAITAEEQAQSLVEEQAPVVAGGPAPQVEQVPEPPVEVSPPSQVEEEQRPPPVETVVEPPLMAAEQVTEAEASPLPQQAPVVETDTSLGTEDWWTPEAEAEEREALKLKASPSPQPKPVLETETPEETEDWWAAEVETSKPAPVEEREALKLEASPPPESEPVIETDVPVEAEDWWATDAETDVTPVEEREALKADTSAEAEDWWTTDDEVDSTQAKQQAMKLKASPPTPPERPVPEADMPAEAEDWGTTDDETSKPTSVEEKEIKAQSNTVRVGSEYQKRERKQRTTPQQSGSRAAKNEV